MKQLKLFGLVLITGLLLALMPAGCHGYKVHPGSINTFDSVTADTLTGIKATLDAARPQLASGALPASLKPAFSVLATAYDTATASYKAWREVAKANPNTPATQLQADLAAATKALSAYFAAGGK